MRSTCTSSSIVHCWSVREYAISSVLSLAAWLTDTKESRVTFNVQRGWTITIIRPDALLVDGVALWERWEQSHLSCSQMTPTLNMMLGFQCNCYGIICIATWILGGGTWTKDIYNKKEHLQWIVLDQFKIPKWIIQIHIMGWLRS